MLEKPLEHLRSSDLGDLIANETAENLRLEFKQSLDLDQRKQRLELAKDISAMANSAGGRILYGIAERKLADGSQVAGEVKPLADGELLDRLERIVVDTVHPRPRFRPQRIDVEGGFVLVVEVYDSYGRDLHLVTGYDEQRFYRRGERSIHRMTEPEIREAYQRIATSMLSLEEGLEAVTADELRIRQSAEESTLVIPWYHRRNLANPVVVHGLRHKLAEGPLRDYDRDACCPITNLHAFSGGIRGLAPARATPDQADPYFVVRRSGVLHLSRRKAVFHDSQGASYSPHETLQLISAAMRAAQVVFDSVGYWGPVRLVHRLMLPCEVRPDRNWPPWPSGTYTSMVGEVNLREVAADFDRVLQELLDELFQAAPGRLRCPWFDDSGHLKEEYRLSLAS